MKKAEKISIVFFSAILFLTSICLAKCDFIAFIRGDSHMIEVAKPILEVESNTPLKIESEKNWFKMGEKAALSSNEPVPGSNDLESFKVKNYDQEGNISEVKQKYKISSLITNLDIKDISIRLFKFDGEKYHLIMTQENGDLLYLQEENEMIASFKQEDKYILYAKCNREIAATLNSTLSINIDSEEILEDLQDVLKELPYTIQFNPNGGEGTMTDLSMIYNKSQNLTSNTFTKKNYTFKNWNTEPDGSGTSYEDGQSVNNLTAIPGEKISLYAQWEYDIEFLDSVGGNSNKLIDTGVKVNNNTRIQIKTKLTEIKPVADGWIFGTGSRHMDAYIVGNGIILDLNFNGDTRIKCDKVNGQSPTANTIYELEFGNCYIKNLSNNQNLVTGQAKSTFTGENLHFNPSNNKIIYYSKIYEGSNLVRDLVPAKQISTGEYGLFDKLHDDFYL